MTALAIVLSFLMGAIGRRVAGGAFQQWTGKDIGDLPVRIFWGVTLGGAAALGHAAWYYCIAVIPLVWIGASVGLFNSLGMGRGKTSYVHDFLGMSAYGGICGALLAAPFAVGHFAFHAAFAWYAPLVAGLLCAPCYECGWRFDPKPSPHWWRGPTQSSELLWGGVMGVGACLAVVL